MEDEHERPTLLGAGGSKVHRRAAGHYHGLATRAPDLLSLRRLQACFSRQRVEGFRTRVGVGRRRHAGVEDGLHVLSRVYPAGNDRKRTDLSYSLSA